MWNDKETDVDLLGHDKIATTILEIINDQNLRPLTIGIYGDWGVGKSSVLSILKSLANNTNKAKVYKQHCVMFNGWLFQGYEDAKTALMETVVSEISELQTLTAKGKTLGKKLFKRINWLKAAKVTAGAALSLATGLPIGGLVAAGIDKAKEALKPDDEESWLNEEDKEGTVTRQISAFRKEFAELVKESKVDHIIIMIDDLDRCLPKTVIEILEAVRLFLFVEGTTFVISADERMIEYAVREHFPNLPLEYKEYTRNYLEKLVQIPVRLPSLTALQTGNYIKLLMVQFYLKGDNAKLATVYQTYEQKKKRPYDNLQLSYEIVSEALADQNTDMEHSITVADQITPTLATSLRGNPRNIKRFLNTLFLRLRIARIYGLEAEVQLSRLAKIMLLERFQPELFDNVIKEVSEDVEGKSKTVAEAEAKLKAVVGGAEEGNLPTPSQYDSWAKIAPEIGTLDLRPYIFISKEKAISFIGEETLSDKAVQTLELLKSGAELALKSAEKVLPELSPSERTKLFERLLADSRAIEDFNTLPNPIKGLLRIIQVDNSFEEKLLVRIESIPPEKIGVWGVSELTGLKTESAKKRFLVLLDKWKGQSMNNRLRKLAQGEYDKLQAR